MNQQFVLDFGAGTGANCSMCTPSHYIGLEPDESRVQFARSLYPDYQFEVLRNHSLPLQDHSVDCLMIVAVLHHISSGEILGYMPEFIRVLKPNGNMVILEPCLCESHPICNRFMKWYDEGLYLRNEPDYLQLFDSEQFECTVLQRFRKCLLYHELLFCAKPLH